MIRSAPSDGGIVISRMSAVAHLRTDRFDLVDIDTLFYIDNRGIRSIQVDVNGHPFKLVVDSVELRQSMNAFLIPEFGEITIDIGALIHPGDGNYMELASRGPQDSDADLIIGDLLLPGQEVAYAIADLRPFPEQFSLLQSFPNPFSERTTIMYGIPEHRTSGLHVTLAIYDLTGRRIQMLVDERRFPGTFSVEWDGRDAQGGAAASGVYLCSLQAGESRQSGQLVLVR